MSTDMFKIKKGIKLKPNSTTLDAEGEIKYNGSGNLILRDGSGEKTVLDEDNSVAVTNKTIVVASNTITTASNGNLAATELNTALAELQTDIDTRALASGLSDHLADTTDAHDASAISSVASGNLAATDVQAALNELQSDIDTRALASGLSDHLSDTADAHDASAISNSPSGNLVATDVQAALNELQTEIDTHLADTAEHGATGAVVGTTNSQTLTNKTLTAPIIDVASLTEQGSTPATPSAGTKKFYAKNDGKLYTLDSNGNEIEVGSGAAGGGIYYINEDFETGVTSLVTYADAAGTQPVDATGGSPNITVTAETVAPLIGDKSAQIAKDAANRQGEGVAIVSDTIDAAYEDKVHVVEFLWKTDSNYADGDMSLWVVHPTTGTVEALYFRDAFGNYSNELPQSASSVLKVISEISPVDPTYKVVIHVASTSATAYEVFVDDIKAGPQKLIPGAIVTDWQAFTPTGTWVSNATYTGRWRRVGDSLEVEGAIALTGAPTAATLEIDLPFALSIDTNKITRAVANEGNYGTAWALAAGTRIPAGPAVYGTDATVIRFLTTNSGTTNSLSAISSTVPGTFANGDDVHFEFKVPISGWDSGAVISTTQADFMGARARYYMAASPSIAHNTVTILDYDTQEYDTHNRVTTGASWKFTSKTAGTLIVNATALVANEAVWAIREYAQLSVYKNGSFYSTIDIFAHPTSDASADAAYDVYLQGCAQVKVDVDDYIDIRALQTSNSSVTFDGGGSVYVEITTIPDYSTFGVFPEKNRIQTKILSADVTTNTTLSDLTFSNLTIGKWYEATGQFYLKINNGASDGGVTVTASHNGSTVGIASITNRETSSTVGDEIIMGFSTKFQASATTLTFASTSASANSYIEGTNTQAGTYVQLEERNDLKETSAW